MKFNAAHFDFDGGTIGFITDAIVASNAKDKQGYLKKQFGNRVYTDDMLAFDSKTKTTYARSIRPSGPDNPDSLFFPYYSMAGLNGDLFGVYEGVYLCVAKKRYGEIGTFIEVKMIRDSADKKQDDLYLMAVIAEHLENMPEDLNGRWGGEFRSDYDNKTRGIELSLIVNNVGDYDEHTWLGGARWRYFNTTGDGSWTADGKTTYAYRTAYIDLISTDLNINASSDTDTPDNPNTADSDFLLKNSEDERKYGINIYEVAQPLIRFSTSGALTGGANGDALSALESYSRFMYSLLNSQVSTANYILVSMPWLRPGFNCWVDPLYSDMIYYISEIQHQGSPTEGATTVASLIFGRPRGEFASSSEAFGAMNDTSDNVFVNTMNAEQRIKGEDGVGPWGAYLKDAKDFQNIKTATEDYYGHEITETTTAANSQFHKSMYVDGVKEAPLSSGINADKIFSGEYTADEIKAKIDAIYASAPSVVKERTTKLKTAVEGAKKYIQLHYDTER